MEFITKYVLPVAWIVVLLIGVAWPAIKNLVDSINETRCPNCGRFWASQKIRDRLLGIFRKGHASPKILRGMVISDIDVDMVFYEKYRIECKCRYCGHMWTFLKTIKQ